MELKKPKYILDEVKALIQEGKCRLTIKATKTAHDLGFSKSDAESFLLQLERKDFIKSMTDHYNNKSWQDVYSRAHNKVKIYIKLKIYETENSNLLILSFKQDENR